MDASLSRPAAAAAPGPGLEAEIHRLGHALAAAFPAPVRHPVRALDEKAMQLSARDHELRAALFRVVDVTPASHPLDDLARHLSGFLE